MTDDELEALLDSVTLPPERKEALRKILKALPIGLRKEARLFRLALIPVEIEHHPDEPNERRYLPLVDPPIWLDDPKISVEVKRLFYTVLARISALVPPQVQSAVITHGLGRSVERADRVAYMQQTAIYRDAIARYKADGCKAPYKKLARLTGESVGSLKQRLRRAK